MQKLYSSLILRKNSLFSPKFHFPKKGHWAKHVMGKCSATKAGQDLKHLNPLTMVIAVN